MTRPAIVKASLLAAGIASAGMAAFHFVLPTVFQWSRFMTDVPDSIVWGMGAINAFFSALLLLASVATIRVALSRRRDTMLVGGMALFWVFNAVYQLIKPFPQRAVWGGTLAFSALMVALYSVALWCGREAPPS
jgi:uncharacterized membrane protein YozB (DUF420 family)